MREQDLRTSSIFDSLSPDNARKLALGIGASLLFFTSHSPVAQSKTPPASSRENKARTLAYDLTHSIDPKSVKVTSANITGVMPMLSNSYSGRELVQIKVQAKDTSIESKHHFTEALQEEVVTAHTVTPGVLVFGPQQTFMDVNMSPFQGSSTATEDYRLYVDVINGDGIKTKPEVAKFYAGTVALTAHNGRLDTATIFRDRHLKAVTLIHPPTLDYINPSINDRSAA